MLYHHFEPALSRYEPVVPVFLPVSAGSAGKFQIDLMGCVFLGGSRGVSQIKVICGEFIVNFKAKFIHLFMNKFSVKG